MLGGFLGRKHDGDGDHHMRRQEHDCIAKVRMHDDVGNQAR